jgi:hypothetical protein
MIEIPRFSMIGSTDGAKPRKATYKRCKKLERFEVERAQS